MFDALRKMIFPIIIIVLVFFLGMIVLQWGLDLTGQGPGVAANYAGAINGDEISWESFQQVYSNLHQQELDRAGGELTEEQIETIEDAAWNQIMQNRLLLQEASKHDITVTDDDVYLYLSASPPQYLQEAPAFQTDAKFDYQKYLGAMADPQWGSFWANQVEPQARLDLRIAKLQQLIVESANVTETEVMQAFLETEETVKIRAIKVPFSKYAQPAPKIDDETLRAHYEANLQNYWLDERIVFDLVSLRKDPSEADWDRAGARAQTLYDSVASGSDFAEIATVYSEDFASAKEGGDLGWFEPGQMVPSFDSVIFRMNENEISKPFRTRFGWHVVQNHGFRQERKVPKKGGDEQLVREAHVSHILVKAVPGQGTLSDLYDQLAELQLAAAEGDFAQAAEEAGLTVTKAGPYRRNEPIETIGRAQEANDFGFNHEVGAVSGVFEYGNYYFIVRLAERIPEGPGDFEPLKSRIEGEMIQEVVAAICDSAAGEVAAAIKAGSSFADAAAQFGYEVLEPNPFARNGTITGIGREPAAVGTAFSLRSPGDISDPVRCGNGTAIFELVSRSTPELTKFNEERDSLMSSVMYTKQQRMYNRWFTQLMEESVIINNIDSMRQKSGGVR